MDIKLDRSALLAALKRCRHACDPKGDQPYKRCVLIETDSPELLRLYTTTSLLWVDTRCTAQVTERGSIAVDCDRLIGIVTAMPDGEIGLSTDPQLQLTCKAIGQRRRYKISGLAGDDFPGLKEAQGAKSYPLVADAFRTAIKLVRAGMDSHVPGRDGVLLDCSGTVACQLITLDGRRLFFADCSLEKAMPQARIFIPRSAIEAVEHFCQNQKVLRIAKDDAYLYLETDESLLTCAIPNDPFPEHVLDFFQTKLLKGDKQCRLLGQKLLEASVGLCAAHESEAGASKNAAGAAIRLTLEGMELSLALARSRNTAEDQIEVDATGTFRVLVDAGFLRDALRDVAVAEVQLGYETEAQALAISAPGYQAFIVRMDETQAP